MFVDDAAVYNGKTVDLRQKMTEIVDGLAECTAFTSVISIPRFAQARDISAVPKAETLASLLSSTAQPPPDFIRIAFHEPSLICFSSGTTGMPKAITHSVGGLLISYAKEGRLHEDLGPTDTGLQYTTTGWIMYVANAALLLFGSRSVFYDGSPFSEYFYARTVIACSFCTPEALPQNLTPNTRDPQSFLLGAQNMVLRARTRVNCLEEFRYTTLGGPRHIS